MNIKKTDVYYSFLIDTIKEMIRLAKNGNFTAEQEINGVTVLVNGDSNADLILRDLRRAISGYITGEVGPYPSKFTAEDKTNDTCVEAKSERERQTRSVEYEKKGINLDDLQQETEKLLALLKDRQPGLMTWNEFMRECLQNLHKFASRALGK